MARGTTLQNLIQQFADEAGLNNSPALSDSAVSMVTRLLRRTQERLYQTYEWPFLHGFSDKVTAAGEYLYDFPTDMDIERIQQVWIQDGGVWYKIQQGISMDEYSVYNTENDVRLDPIQRWAIRDADQFEVWPVPATNGKVVRFEGVKKLSNSLENLTDRADLDDTLIVLFSVAEYLRRDSAKREAADAKLAEANNQLLRTRGQLSSSTVTPLTAGASLKAANRYGYSDKIIRVATSTT